MAACTGYFLPAEGASDKALALFSFPSLAAYEQYRALFGRDPDFIEADRIRTRAAACSVTSGPSCGPCCPDTQPGKQHVQSRHVARTHMPR